MNFNKLCLQACCKAVYHKHLNTTRHTILQIYIFLNKNNVFCNKMFIYAKRECRKNHSLFTGNKMPFSTKFI